MHTGDITSQVIANINKIVNAYGVDLGIIKDINTGVYIPRAVSSDSDSDNDDEELEYLWMVRDMWEELKSLLYKIEQTSTFNHINDCECTILIIIFKIGFRTNEIANIMKETVTFLYKCGAKLNEVNDLGRTALWYVCQYSFKKAETAKQSKDVMIELLKCGADPNIFDSDGVSPLMCICKRGFKKKETAEASRDVIFKILEQTNNKQQTININPTIYNETLDKLCRYGFVEKESAIIAKEVVIKLLSYVVDINYICGDDEHGLSIIMAMCCIGFKNTEVGDTSQEVVLELLKQGAKLNYSDRTNDTILAYFCHQCEYSGKKSVGVVAMFVDYGLNVHMWNKHGLSGKAIANKNEKTEIVEYLQEIEDNFTIYPLATLCILLINKNYPIFKTQLINYPPLLLIPPNLLLFMRREKERINNNNNTTVINYY